MIAVNLFDLACFMQAEPVIGGLLFRPANPGPGSRRPAPVRRSL
jgi:hypothetical protein